MKYIIDTRYRLRGWHGAPTGVYDTQKHEAHFVAPALYKLVMKCDAAQDIDPEALPEKEAKFLKELLAEKVVRPAGRWDFLLPEQRYHAYPARYRKSVHWWITGACNLRCRHCFMSAPHAKHGVPSHEEIINIADQLAECGVFNASLTGGEPLIREDFLDIVDALAEREIALTTIYTNGWLVNEELLDSLEKRGVHPSFQLSFDGIGWHDFLRGVPGAEEKTIAALKLLQERKYSVSVSMCIHRKSAHVLRDSVRLLASLGVTSVKCGSMMEQGEWASPDVAALQLTKQEELEMFEKYIPQYFEDDAPLSIMMSGAFLYEKSSDHWGIFYHRECPADQEDKRLSCPVLGESFYIGADGVVAPCQGMCDCDFGKNFPTLKEKPLREILTDSDYVKLSYATVGDVRRGLATIPCKNGQAVSDEPSCILQKYIGRALVLTTNDCAARCRFCFRRSSLRRALFPIVDADQKKGSPQVENKAANGPDFNERLESVFAPVRANPSIHELVFSGGDPLTLSNDQLKSLLDYIKTLRAVNRVRFHSRVPILVPQRIDQGFPSSDDINRRDSSKTLILHISLHVNSPNEINGSVVNSLAELRRRGYLLTSQTVLLKGINDSVEVLVELFEKLANAGVIPYYLHQLDHVQGAAHFETPVAKGLQLMKEIASRLPGYAVPRYVREIPGRAMKTDLQAEPDADVDYD